MLGMMIDIGPKFYSAPPHPWSGHTDQVHTLRNFMLKFYVKVFRIIKFLNHMVNLNYVWYDDRHWSKILSRTINNPGHDLQVKVTD